MKNFIGIDLGTTNSAICTYDGSETRMWKSPEQNDVTPSAIYIDRRGHKHVGQRAYDVAPRSPGNAATLFKRFMGTSTPVELSAVNVTLTPEECSAEILKALYGYLPEEVRNDPDTGTVITVPAAFNQMQKDATMQAANKAGIGKIELIQEPVAAVMSVMRARKTDGTFLIYDIGGGTTDIAIAESIGGRVNLLSQGGIPMCGGRDFDRSLVGSVVRPWLREKFDLPEDFSGNPTFKSLNRLATWVTERAKIELSSREATVIRLDEMDARTQDLNGDEIYLDIPLDRDCYTPLIVDRVNETIDAARETLSSAGLAPHDLECIVWVGGPTNYKPLRDQVSFELGIPGDLAVNPMTAVAEGASLFAESIDWSSKSPPRLDIRGQISSQDELNVTFRYIARTPTDSAQIGIQLEGQVATGSEFQIDSVDTGWSSGRLRLQHGVTIEVSLTKDGENTFRVSAFDAVGEPISLEQNEIVINKTAATVDAIPASHSIALEVLERLGGTPRLEYLVRKDDPLPKKDRLVVKAGESLEAGSSRTLNFKLWEGDIKERITDNRFIGTLRITGKDFDHGIILIGEDLECDYEISDSGNLYIEVSVKSIAATFDSDRNFYDSKVGRIDPNSATDREKVAGEAAETLSRIDELGKMV
ncbi:MAG: Hsp70 family protein, partial [Candidatus Poribacteria bacterium]|nr:Hsp70 family protein [Candidatus Poribacteria bacterium]